MRSVKGVLRVRVVLALLGVLILGLAAVIGGFLRSRPGPMPGGQAYPPPEGEKPIALAPSDTPYPPPAEGATPIPVTAQPTQMLILVGTNEYAAPTLTPWSTFTLFPSPTQRPGSTSTPIPLTQPARDAAGTLLYLEYRPEVGKALYTLALDTAGRAKSAPVQISISSEVGVPEGDVYTSPDGQRMAIIGAWGVGVVLDINTGRSKYFPGVSGYLFFNWYPDNRQVLVRDDFTNLLLVDLVNEEDIPLAVPGYGAIDGAAASPDGRKVIYSDEGGLSRQPKIMMVNADGRDARKLFDTSYLATNFSWSPDGSSIAFFGDGFMVMDKDGTNLRRVGKHNVAIGYLFPPIWSPDSSTLAIVTSSSSSSFIDGWGMSIFDGTNIYLIDVNSGEERPITPDGLIGNIDPAWSPDGKQIAFVSNRSGSGEIWVVNTDGSNLRQLTNAGQFVRYPYWRRP